jgi:hypothetical protein
MDLEVLEAVCALSAIREFCGAVHLCETGYLTRAVVSRWALSFSIGCGRVESALLDLNLSRTLEEIERRPCRGDGWQDGGHKAEDNS